MPNPSQKELANLLQKQIVKFSNRKLICFSGFPACGKTTITKLIIQDKEIINIPTENFILSRFERDNLGLSGCDPKAYKMKELQLYVNQVLVKQKDVFVIVDGTVSIELAKSYPDKVQIFWFQPENLIGWIKFATQRDIKERMWRIIPSVQNNLKKMVDCWKLYRKYKSMIGCQINTRYDLTNKGTISYGIERS